MDDEIGAEQQRLLQVRRRECVVDDEQRTDRVRRVCGAPDVDDVEERVRRRLEPDEANRLVEVRGEAVVELGRRDVREAVALRLVDLRRHPVDAPVDVGDQDDALPGIDEVHQGRRRAEPGAERDPVLRLLEARQRLLQRAAGRVRDARVVVALVHADRVLHERRRLVDRRRDRAGRRIRLLADMNRARLELHCRSVPSPTGRTPRGQTLYICRRLPTWASRQPPRPSGSDPGQTRARPRCGAITASPRGRGRARAPGAPPRARASRRRRRAPSARA